MTRLSRNVVFNLAGQCSTLLFAALAVKFVFRRLGDDAFGLIFFNLTLSATLLVALELGVTGSIVREVAAHHDDDPRYIHALVRTASTMYWALYALLLLAVIALAPFLVERWLHLHAIPAPSAIAALRILSAGSLLQLPQGLYASLLRGRQRMGLTNSIDVSMFALQQIGIVVILAARGSLPAVTVWLLVSSLFEVGVYMIAAARLFNWSGLMPGWSDEAFRRNRAYTARLASVSVTAMIHTQADKIVASRLFTVVNFGLYSFVSSICARTTVLSGAVASAALPSLSNLSLNGQTERLATQYRKLQDLLCLAMLPVLAGLVFASPLLFRFVFDPAVAERLLLPTVLLSVGYYMNATLTIPFIMCLASGRADIPARTNVVALFVVLPVTVTLVWKLGMVGGGLSWVVFHLFSYSYLVPRACDYCIHQRPSDWFLHVGRIAVAGIITFGMAWVLLGGDSSILRTIASYFAGLVAYAFAVRVLIGPDLRRSARDTAAASGALARRWRSRRSG
jgi:O-antigen/teichoic acid export membrane protein